MASPDRDDRPAGNARLMLFMLALVGMLNYFDRVLVTVLAQPLKAEFGLSDTQLGLLTGPAFVVVYVTSSLAAGWLADRKNRRNLVAAALALWSGLTMASASAGSFLQLALLRGGVAVGEGGCTPAVFSLISDTFRPERRTGALGIYYAISMLGISLSFLIGGFVSTHYGWRIAFLVCGAPGVLLAGFLFLLREPPRGAMDSGAAGAQSLRTSEAARSLLQNRAYRWISLAAAIGTFSSLGMLQWLPLVFIRSHGMDLTEVGLFFGPPMTIGLMLGMLAGGGIGDWIAKRSISAPLLLCAAMTALTIPLYCFVLWSGSTSAAIAVTFLAAVFATLGNPAATAAMQNVCAPTLRGLGAAFYTICSAVIGQAMMPLAVGVLSDRFSASFGAHALRPALTILVLGTGVAVVLYIVAWRATRDQLRTV